MDNDADQHHFCGKGVLRGVDNGTTILFMKKQPAMPYRTPQKTGCWIKKRRPRPATNKIVITFSSWKKNSAATAGPELP
jgi:hypothetical protein